MLSTTNLDIRGHFLSNNLRLGFTKIIAIIIEVQFGIKNKSTAMRVFTKNADVLKTLSVPNLSAPFTCSVSRNNNNMTKLILKSPLYSAKGQSCVASKLFFSNKTSFSECQMFASFRTDNRFFDLKNSAKMQAGM
jgi:hypothetical protein